MKGVAFALFAGAEAELVHVPGGHALQTECIVEVPNGEVIDLHQRQRRNGCESTGLGVQIYAADVHLQSEEPLTSFTADWVVPALPAHDYGQTVYFWPGFKAKQPEMGLPVLQPVLQYGQHGQSWELQSWFVWGNGGESVVAPAIKVQPGDHLTSYMSQSADGEMWTVSGTDLTTGQDSTLNIKYTDAGNTDYDFAMLVNENIEVNTGCALMPADTEVVFTNVTVNGEVPVWTTRANCKGDSSCDCDNTAVVDAAGVVHLGWNPDKPTHYSQPPCAMDEEEVVQVLGGTVCAVKCSSSDDCPKDVPFGTAATPQCSLKNLDGYCGLKCGFDSGCPDGGKCKKSGFSLNGVCVYESSAVVL